METKLCKRCGEEKPKTLEFFVLRRPKNRRNPHWENVCRGCIAKNKRQQYSEDPDRFKAAMRKRQYGITEFQFNDLMILQNGSCAICGFVFENASKNITSPHVDHCHDTKKIRGLLYTNCNAGLGQFKDSPEILQRAIKYLQENS